MFPTTCRDYDYQGKRIDIESALFNSNLAVTKTDKEIDLNTLFFLNIYKMAEEHQKDVCNDQQRVIGKLLDLEHRSLTQETKILNYCHEFDLLAKDYADGKEDFNQQCAEISNLLAQSRELIKGSHKKRRHKYSAEKNILANKTESIDAHSTPIISPQQRADIEVLPKTTKQQPKRRKQPLVSVEDKVKANKEETSAFDKKLEKWRKVFSQQMEEFRLKREKQAEEFRLESRKDIEELREWIKLKEYNITSVSQQPVNCMTDSSIKGINHSFFENPLGKISSVAQLLKSSVGGAKESFEHFQFYTKISQTFRACINQRSICQEQFPIIYKGYQYMEDKYTKIQEQHGTKIKIITFAMSILSISLVIKKFAEIK